MFLYTWIDDGRNQTDIIFDVFSKYLTATISNPLTGDDFVIKEGCNSIHTLNTNVCLGWKGNREVFLKKTKL